MGFKSSRNSRTSSKSNDRDDSALADDFADALLAGDSPWLDNTRLDEAAIYASALSEVISEGQELELRGPRTEAEKDRLERLARAVKPMLSALKKSRVFTEKTRRITNTALAAEHERLYLLRDRIAVVREHRIALRRISPDSRTAIAKRDRFRHIAHVCCDERGRRSVRLLTAAW